MILKHIEEVMCDSHKESFDYMMSWMAHLIQKPQDKVGVCLVFISEQGAGKGTFWEWFMNCVLGRRYSHTVTDLESLTGAFNKRMESKMLCVLNEIGTYGGSLKVFDKMKSILTDPTIYIQPKGLEAYECKDYCRYIMTTNSEWAARIEHSDRRWAIIAHSNKKIGDMKYFETLRSKLTQEQAAALVEYLKKLDISSWDRTKIPATKQRQEMKIIRCPRLCDLFTTL